MNLIKDKKKKKEKLMWKHEWNLRLIIAGSVCQ